MTLAQLSKEAGTSIATVSKAFSGSREVSNETRERIFAIARENGCFEKYFKAPRERPIIALLFPETESEFYGHQIGMLERTFSKHGADTIVALTRFDSEREARLFKELAYKMKVDGIIISGSGKLITNPDEIPLVAIAGDNARIQNADIVRVSLDRAMEELIEIIKDYGHKNVGFIGERLTESKLMQFSRSMRKYGLPLHKKYIAISDKRFASAGEECMRMLIDSGDIPSVIVAAYDQIAYGAMRYAISVGYRIPEDISFVGIDDISPTQYADIPLSSIHISLEDVCESVVDLMYRRMDNRHFRRRSEIRVPMTVKIRRSLGKIN